MFVFISRSAVHVISIVCAQCLLVILTLNILSYSFRIFRLVANRGAIRTALCHCVLHRIELIAKSSRKLNGSKSIARGTHTDSSQAHESGGIAAICLNLRKRDTIGEAVVAAKTIN